MPDNHNVKTTVIAETDNFMIWVADEAEGETTYNVELGNLTLHLFQEEWDEFLKLMQSVKRGK